MEVLQGNKKLPLMTQRIEAQSPVYNETLSIEIETLSLPQSAGPSR
jgi:hypothetical protein